VRNASNQTYRIKEFATLTGVSVRTLRHYDRLGLLKARRTTSGYRIYATDDVAVLEQIVALKFIGVSLRDIKRLLRTERRDLTGVLVAQRIILEGKRRHLDLAIAAVRDAQELGRQQPDAGRIKRIIEVIKMQDKRDEFKKQYDALVTGKIDRLRTMSPEARERLRGQFAELSKEIQGVLDQDPAGPRAQELAGRWLELLQAFAPKGEVDPQLLKLSMLPHIFRTADGQLGHRRPTPRLADPFGSS
jgi:DNA-binding transcriptional MerR regulator